MCNFWEIYIQGVPNKTWQSRYVLSWNLDINLKHLIEKFACPDVYKVSWMVQEDYRLGGRDCPWSQKIKNKKNVNMFGSYKYLNHCKFSEKNRLSSNWKKLNFCSTSIYRLFVEFAHERNHSSIISHRSWKPPFPSSSCCYRKQSMHNNKTNSLPAREIKKYCFNKKWSW